jgi:hypothetical protein
MDSIIVRPYNRTSLGWFALGLFFVVIFTYVLVGARNELDIRVAHGMLAFWGPITAFWAVFLIPSSSYVKADAGGIECRTFWLQWLRLTWADIDSIAVVDFPATWGLPRFGWTHIFLSKTGQEKMRHSFFQKITRGKFGINVGIPHVYGSPSYLAQVLNARKKHFGPVDGDAKVRYSAQH